MNPDSGQMGEINEDLKKMFEEIKEPTKPFYFNSIKDAQENGFKIPFEVGEKVDIKGCHFIVNNFVQSHNFMNLKLIKRTDDDRPHYTLRKEPFIWMKEWLNSYNKENDDINVDKIIDWIYRQPMAG